MANSSINLINLDFDTLKSSFVNYLKQQSQFQDYNFDGSALNVLLDILSYNTYKNAFYTNMIFAESFLDSAQLKESLYSHAKELNYLPRSARSSVANVTISFLASGESQPYIIRKGETFTTVIKQSSYTFSVSEDIILTSSNTTYTSTFDIYEGFYTKDSYVMDYSEQNQRFKLTNDNVDVDSLVVLVYEDSEETPKKFLRARTLLDLNERSQVYFLQPTTDAKYEVIFGDNILGRKPKNGSTIVLDYRVTSGSAANGAKAFSINFDPTGTNSELLNAVSVIVNKFTADTQGAYSVNGAEPESNESIRYYAPRHFQTQERAITVNDYETILKTQFPEIGAISVYGGEEVNPPRYGKVFVAVDVKNVEGLPDAKKIEYYNYIKSRSPLSIDPIFTEPSFTYVRVNSYVKYNINLTTRTTQNIKADVLLTVNDFAETYLNDFKSSLRYSKLVRTIDDVDSSIVSNETELHVYKKVVPRLSVPQNIDFNFNIPIQETDYVSDQVAFVSSTRHTVKDTRAVHSTYFRYNGEKCLIEDDGAGKLRIVREEGNFHYVIREVGTVNYKTGEVKLVNFTVDTYEGNYFKIYITPANKDIIGSRNEILAIEPDEIILTVEAIRE
jgi:hypothetical protein